MNGNRDIYSLLNLVLLLIVIVFGWPHDIVLAMTLLATDRWLFIAATVVIVVLLLIRPFLLIIIFVPIFFVLRWLLVRLVVV